MDKAFKAVQQLVKDFSENEAAYLAASYQESQARQDFIDKLFTALGWDVTHERQKNPYEQEVTIEKNVQTAGSQRRADYAFFIAPNFRDVKFFAEAKKPSHDLKNPDYYHQAIRYGWNQGTPLAVLTDFEEFHILDCRYKPNIETALGRNVKTYRYKDYANKEKFAEIFYLFGRDAVAEGSIEKFAATLPKPRGKAIQKGFFKGGYQPVDEAFLEELDGYRETLAKAFKKKNQELEGEELTEAVQRTIDRLVFIRFLEDKQIEDLSIINYREKKSAWEAFLAHCKSLEPKYNGLVFKPHRIIDGNKFNPPDDTAFADICDELADPTSPYDFNHIPISILGSIYERFLGKVVRTTPQQAKVEPKPEVRKAGGVYYTPEYIVRYIVNETVGKLIEGKTPEQIAQMAFADIACGSGSFLIEVYSQLLEYHARYYAQYPDKARKDDIAKREGKTVLSLKKRQEILLNNIYGVDIDFQATEVTQLSLYLKLLEDATMNDSHQFALLKEKILPDLRNNIVCGNSLIGTDILEGDLFGREEDKKLNPMNFADAFPKIMKRGGFDAVVGNPPWVDIKGMDPKQVDYFFKHYATVENRMNVYAVFLQVGLSLMKPKGLFGYITPNSYLTQSSYSKLREWALSKYGFRKIIRLPDDVFKKVKAETTISILESDKNRSDEVETFVYDPKKRIDRIDAKETIRHHYVNQKSWVENKGMVINIFSTSSSNVILDKISIGKNCLKDFCEFCLGLTPYDKYKGHTKKEIQSRVFHAKFQKNKTFKPLLSGENIARYSVRWDKKEWISYGKWLGAPREKRFFTEERILVRQIVSGNPLRIYAGYTDKEYYNAQIAFNLLLRENVSISLKYILALLNSSLINYYHRNKYLDQTKKLFQKILIENAKELPIRTINFSDPEDKARHDRIVKLVEQMLAAKEKLPAAIMDNEVNKLEIHIAALDRHIDEAVYELYGLTEEEIKVVEGA